MAESVVLNGLQLNDNTTYRLEAFSVTPARKKPEWISGGDSNGAILGREALYENRVVTCRVRVVQQSTMALALAKVADLTNRLQEAEKGGVDCVWTPHGASVSGTLKVLMGEIDSLPVVEDGDDAGWFVRSPVAEFSLTCKPGIRGTEVTGPSATAATPVVTVEMTGVTGDLDADGRLRVTDNAVQHKRYFDWGVESRYYPTSSPPDLLVDSDSLVTTGFSGAGNTRTGAYDPNATGNNVIRATLATQPSAVCGTGVLAHVGTFRVKARIYVASGSAPHNTSLRLSWQDGDGPMRGNAWVNPVAVGAWSEVDLGVVRVETTYAGTQRWSGRLEAVSTGTGDILDVDYIRLVPAGEGHGYARAAFVSQPGVLVGRDEFTSIAVGTALNSRTAPAGGSWATSGASTDFTAADGPVAGQETMSRSVVSDTGRGRLAILGTTDYTDVEVGLYITDLIDYTTILSGTATITQSVIARYTDANNYFELALVQFVDTATATVGEARPTYTLEAISRVAGVSTVVSSVAVGSATGDLRLTVSASGAFTGTFGTATVSGTRTELATGGTLATGEPGFRDMGPTSSTPTGTRYYDNFYVSQPPAEPIVIVGGLLAEVTHERAMRLASGSAYWGQVPAYRGSYFTVPPAGVNTRKARVAVAARRNDILVAPDDPVTDSITVQTYYTPVWLTVPR